MSDLLLNIIVLGGFLIIIGIILLVVFRRQHATQQAIDHLAQQHGWQIRRCSQPLTRGYQIIARDWSLEGTSRSEGREAGPGSTNISQTTTWSASIPGQPYLIGPAQTRPDLGQFGEMLQEKILRKALGLQAVGLHQIQMGGTAFREKFAIWAKEGEDVPLTPTIEKVLLAWKGIKPVIKRTHEGLTIEIQGAHYKKPDDILNLIHLGEMFL